MRIVQSAGFRTLRPKAFRFKALMLLLGAPLALSAQQFASAPDTSQAPVEPKAPHSFDLNAIDKTADPCTDFYQYACGNWRKSQSHPQ